MYINLLKKSIQQSAQYALLSLLVGLGLSVAQAQPITAQSITIEQQFNPATVALGQASTLTITLTNNTPNAFVGGRSGEYSMPYLTHELPQGLKFTPNTTPTIRCDQGTPGAIDTESNEPDILFILNGGNYPVGSRCLVDVSVTAVAAGVYTSEFWEEQLITNQFGYTNTDSIASLNVSSPPTVLKYYGDSPNNIPTHLSTATARVMLVVENPNPSAIFADGLTEVSFTDYLPEGTRLAISPDNPLSFAPNCQSTDGQPLSYQQTADTLTFSNIKLSPAPVVTQDPDNPTPDNPTPDNPSPSNRCQITYPIILDAPGPAQLTSQTSGADSLQTAVGLPSPPAKINVWALPKVTKRFEPQTIASGTEANIFFTLSHPNNPLDFPDTTFDWKDKYTVSLTDHLPTGMRYVANSLKLVAGAGQCSGGYGAPLHPIPESTAETISVSVTAQLQEMYPSGTVPSRSCTYSATVTVDQPGTYTNTTDPLKITLNNQTVASNTATATLQASSLSLGSVIGLIKSTDAMAFSDDPNAYIYEPRTGVGNLPPPTINKITPVGDGSYRITVENWVRNFTDQGLSEVVLTDPLSPVFGTAVTLAEGDRLSPGQYQVSGVEILSGTGLSLNPHYNGEQQSVLATGTLAAGLSPSQWIVTDPNNPPPIPMLEKLKPGEVGIRYQLHFHPGDQVRFLTQSSVTALTPQGKEASDLSNVAILPH